MKPIEKSRLTAELARYKGTTAYVHLEVNPGAFMRNVPIVIADTFGAGEGPYRVALRTMEGGWIRAEGLTDMDASRDGQLLLAGHDSAGRITTALQLSLTPFDFDREASTE